MTPTDARALIQAIKETPWAVRNMKSSSREWDFVNSIDHLTKLGKTLTPKQGWKLESLFRVSQGHYNKRYSRVE